MYRPTLLRLILGAGAAAAVTTLTLPGQAATRGPAFTAPVRVTPPNGGGYEPGIYPDRYGNLFATAHKENAELALSPDARSATRTRSMSWAWQSADGGATWKNLPLGPADIYDHNFGDEGDMALDDAGNLYFVDTNVTDITFTAWKVTGRGKVGFTRHLPSVGFGEPVDDRPWITAHGDGHVFYFGNEGNKGEYAVADQSAGPGAGPGRYTVYSSYDGGQTWDHIGIQLDDSGWCRPAAAPRSSYVYALCANDEGRLFSYVSPDDGKKWFRYDVGTYNAQDGWASYPTLQVLRDGTLWGFYLDGQTSKCPKGSTCDPRTAKFRAYRSTDHGRTWKTFDITPTQPSWQYEYGWMSVSDDGRTLGYAVYGRPDPSKAFRVYATTLRPGQRPTLTSIDEAHPVTPAGYPAAPGDFLMAAFDRAGKLNVTWTRDSTAVASPDGGHALYRDIFFAKTR